MHNTVARRIIICLGAVLLAMTGFSLNNRKVDIYDGTTKVSRMTSATTVAEFIKESDININEGEKLVPHGGAKLRSGTEIRIMQAVPVTIVVDGKVFEKKLHALTIADALRETNVVLGRYDKVNHGLTERLVEGMVIDVKRIQVQAEIVERDVPFGTEIILDDRLEKGLSKVIRPGQAGRARIVKEKVVVNQRVSQHRTGTKHIIKHPISELVAMGNKTTISRGGQNINFARAIVLEATAYEPGYRSNGKWAGITAMGTKLRHGVVAVDPRVIPLGTRLYVDGYGFAVAEDTGGAIKGKRIDLLYPTYEAAMRFGRQQVKVYILD
jgi:3D (Asp-Asp-Asp) domain-containing protein